MGAAAYNRGTQSIRNGLARDYQQSPSHQRDIHDQFVRAEGRIQELEQFCRDAQNVLVQITDNETARGFALSVARYTWLKKRDTKRYKTLQDELVSAHCAWVDSDRKMTFDHLSVCLRKAKVLHQMLDYLNKAYVWRFPIPAFL